MQVLSQTPAKLLGLLYFPIFHCGFVDFLAKSTPQIKSANFLSHFSSVIAFTANYYLSLHLAHWVCFVVYKLHPPQNVATSAPDKCTGSIADCSKDAFFTVLKTLKCGILTSHVN